MQRQEKIDTGTKDERHGDEGQKTQRKRTKDAETKDNR